MDRHQTHNTYRRILDEGDAWYMQEELPFIQSWAYRANGAELETARPGEASRNAARHSGNASDVEKPPATRAAPLPST